jgi:phospholipid/cholesterol/gamma-HCH transport system ATP-binding protein
VIEGKSISKSFDGELVLNDINISFQPGEIVGIVGPGGVGKSLLMKILCGLVPADEGGVSIRGQVWTDLTVMEKAALRESFGMLFQNYALFDFMTVGENVAFPLRQRHDIPNDEIERRVTERLAQVELPGVHGLYSRELSGGMKKRVAMARATIAEAPIIIYDDPTAGLDPVTSSKIFNLIASLHREDSLTLIASHDIERMIPVCQRYIMLYEGEVYFRGTAIEARESDDAVLRTFFSGDHVNVGRASATERGGLS